MGLHTECAQGQGRGQRSRDTDTFAISENRFFSQANGWIATKLAHDGSQPGLHPGCAQGQDHFVANFLESVSVKECSQSVNIC